MFGESFGEMHCKINMTHSTFLDFGGMVNGLKNGLGKSSGKGLGKVREWFGKKFREWFREWFGVADLRGAPLSQFHAVFSENLAKSYVGAPP